MLLEQTIRITAHGRNTLQWKQEAKNTAKSNCTSFLEISKIEMETHLLYTSDSTFNLWCGQNKIFEDLITAFVTKQLINLTKIPHKIDAIIVLLLRLYLRVEHQLWQKRVVMTGFLHRTFSPERNMWSDNQRSWKQTVSLARCCPAESRSNIHPRLSSCGRLPAAHQGNVCSHHTMVNCVAQVE